jgi:hypothetical protein
VAVRRNSFIGSPSMHHHQTKIWSSAVMESHRRAPSILSDGPICRGVQARRWDSSSLLVLPVVFLLLSTCNSILPPSIVRKLIICLGSSRSSSGTCSRWGATGPNSGFSPGFSPF